MEYGLGRLEAPDVRDSDYPMAAVVPATSARLYRYWNDNQWWGDQGSRPWCVAYAWLHWAEDGPVTHKEVAPPLYTPASVYNTAQRIDEWPGENYDGTSVRAGAKVLQQNGIISGYYWAQNVTQIATAILEKGPVVVGTKWYQGMSRPSTGNILHPVGDLLGGHAYVLNGVSMAKKMFRMKNSWGRDWGRKGRAWLPFDAMSLLLNDGGEACLAAEIN